MRISYVVEGATDYHVLDALVERFLDTDDYIPTQIQPPISEVADHQGPLGGGWKGVLKWCEDIGSNADGISMVLANCDFLIIHVDADVASEADLQTHGLSTPCPPAKDTCDKIRNHLVSLFGGHLPRQVVLCVPAQCTETWIFAALHIDELSKYQPIECRPDADRLLIGKPDRLVRDKAGQAKKQTEKYKKTAPKIAREWLNASSSCPEALRFEMEFKAAV